MAGHSKWANIQHRKGRQDAVRSKLFSKLSKEITVAAKMGDPDPEKNPRLRLAVREAKTNSVPKDVIERAIKKSESGNFDNFEEIRYEGYGTGGVAIIVECLTDNRNRTASIVRSVFTKFGGSLAETGAVSFMFERKGLILYSETVISMDEFMELIIEAGGEDLDSDSGDYLVYCDPSELHKVEKALELKLGQSKNSKLIWKPTTVTSLDLDGAKTFFKLISALEDDDDVQSVISNVEISEEIIDQLG